MQSVSRRIILTFLVICFIFSGSLAQEEPDSGFVIEKVGFKTPESVLYDSDADVYLVSNINGSPLGEDDNGFISRINASDRKVNLKWIDGSSETVTLNAPKGMAIIADRLYVSDVNFVRIFDLNNGEPLGEVFIAGSVFLNDIAVGPDGTVYVTDSNAGKIHRIDSDGKVVMLNQGKKLKRPNGIIWAWDRLIVVSFGGNEIYSVDQGGKKKKIAKAPTGQLDGVVLLNDGRLALSSWEGSSVYRLDLEGKIQPMLTDVRAPADIGYDSKRDLLLIPLFYEHKVIAKPAGCEQRNDK
ncbi:SMP-30/gluconolactonase/LRE family protein [bacterium]|nr:SMP-30/gluconolactonase/LRE family protein [bacterium]